MNETTNVAVSTTAEATVGPDVVIGPGNLLWTRHTGRDEDGDKFFHDVLSDDSSIIYAIIEGPCSGDEYQYRVTFFLAVDETDAGGYRSLRFLSLSMAKLYVERIVNKKRTQV